MSKGRRGESSQNLIALRGQTPASDDENNEMLQEGEAEEVIKTARMRS